MASRSLCLPPARTQRWTEAARGGRYGTGSSPRNSGTNGIIPELVNMGALGCVGMRLPDGTIVCCLASKNSVQERRSSAEVRGAISGVGLVLPCAFALQGLAGGARPRAQLGPQLGLPLGHGAPA